MLGKVIKVWSNNNCLFFREIELRMNVLRFLSHLSDPLPLQFKIVLKMDFMPISH